MVVPRGCLKQSANTDYGNIGRRTYFVLQTIVTFVIKYCLVSQMGTDKIKLSSLEPMDIIHRDQFEFNGVQYLAMRDQLSCYTWMYKLTQTDTSHVLTQLDILESMSGCIKRWSQTMDQI